MRHGASPHFSADPALRNRYLNYSRLSVVYRVSGRAAGRISSHTPPAEGGIALAEEAITCY